MGVYIPGIKMPESCSKCRDSGLKFAIDELGLKCPERKELWGPTEAEIKGICRTDCPLIYVQAHGRLGDLDELKERATKRLYASNHGSMAETYYAALIDLIDTAPAIIPWEGESGG